MNKHLPVLIVLLSFSLAGCSESSLLDIANNERVLKLSNIYDCRSQNRHPWGDSAHSQVHTYLLDFSNKRGLKQTGYYKETILESPFDYKLKDRMSDSYQFEQIFFDIDNLEETSTFLRFTSFVEEGESSSFVINKQKSTLSPIPVINKEFSDVIDRMAELGFSQEWVLDKTGRLWEYYCKKI